MTDETQPAAIDHKRNLRNLGVWGLTAIGLFSATVGAWSVATTISGAVVAPGQFVVDGNVKKVQHPTGGIVGQLLVREGDWVEKGDLLIRLDETQLRSSLQMVTKQLDEFAARSTRLRAERDGLERVPVAAELRDRQSETAVRELVASENTLFEARRVAREGQRLQLRKRIDQLQNEIDGVTAQQLARDRQAVLIAKELESVLGLFSKNLVPLTRKNALEREVAALDGQKGQLIATVAQAEGKIAETRLQIQQIDDILREESVKELRDIEAKTAELTERRIAAEDQLKRVEIRAPTAGQVHQLAVHTVGGVISAAEPACLWCRHATSFSSRPACSRQT
jgi:HlyD family secretion protein